MGIFFVVLAYGALKLQHLLKRKNPLISTNVDVGALSEGQTLNLVENEFAMAFGVMDWKEGVLDDPRYSKWVAIEYVKDGDNSYSTVHPLHQCTERDFEKFHSPAPETLV